MFNWFDKLLIKIGKKILNIDKINLDFLNVYNFKNQIDLIKNNNNFY